MASSVAQIEPCRTVQAKFRSHAWAIAVFTLFGGILVAMRWKTIVMALAALLGARAAPADDLRDQISAAQSAGDYRTAAKLYRQLIAEGVDTPEVRSNLGIALHMSGNNRDAVEQFTMALREKPALISANLFAGLAYIDLGEAQRALPLLEKARHLDPQSPAPLLALGKALVALRDFSRSNDNYRKAAQLNPGLADAWYGAGVTDRSQAEQLLKKAVRGTSPTGKEALEKEANGLLARALEELTRAVQLAPESARQHLILAESLSEAGRLVDSIPEFEAAMKLDPGSQAACLGLATAFWRQRQFADAQPLLQRVLTSAPQDPEANAMLADILEHDGDRESAVRHARIALAGNPDLFQPHVVLGRVYLAEGKPQPAIAELRQVAAADPDGSYHFLLFRAYKLAGDEPDARTALAEFERLRQKRSQH